MAPPIFAKKRQLPFITISMIMINLLLFGHTLTLNTRALAQFMRQWAIQPVQLFTDFSREFITLLTAFFLHGSWVQLATNMAAIIFFGRLVEQHFRPNQATMLLFVSGLTATFAQLLIEPANAVPIMGASGIVAGFIGAALTIHQTNISRVQLFAAAALWFIAQQFNGFFPLQGLQFQVGSSAFFSAVGGITSGILVAKRLRPTPKQLR
ncbi:MAG: rhomboid family intramembrane serine protease [Candidatus Promineifilaceae bacterium]